MTAGIFDPWDEFAEWLDNWWRGSSEGMLHPKERETILEAIMELVDPEDIEGAKKVFNRMARQIGDDLTREGIAPLARAEELRNRLVNSFYDVAPPPRKGWGTRPPPAVNTESAQALYDAMGLDVNDYLERINEIITQHGAGGKGDNVSGYFSGLNEKDMDIVPLKNLAHENLWDELIDRGIFQNRQDIWELENEIWNIVDADEREFHKVINAVEELADNPKWSGRVQSQEFAEIVGEKNRDAILRALEEGETAHYGGRTLNDYEFDKIVDSNAGILDFETRAKLSRETGVPFEPQSPEELSRFVGGIQNEMSVFTNEEMVELFKAQDMVEKGLESKLTYEQWQLLQRDDAAFKATFSPDEWDKFVKGNSNPLWQGLDNRLEDREMKFLHLTPEEMEQAGREGFESLGKLTNEPTDSPFLPLDEEKPPKGLRLNPTSPEVIKDYLESYGPRGPNAGAKFYGFDPDNPLPMNAEQLQRFMDRSISQSMDETVRILSPEEAKARKAGNTKWTKPPKGTSALTPRGGVGFTAADMDLMAGGSKATPLSKAARIGLLGGLFVDVATTLTGDAPIIRERWEKVAEEKVAEGKREDIAWLEILDEAMGDYQVMAPPNTATGQWERAVFNRAIESAQFIDSNPDPFTKRTYRFIPEANWQSVIDRPTQLNALAQAGARRSGVPLEQIKAALASNKLISEGGWYNQPLRSRIAPVAERTVSRYERKGTTVQ